MIDDDFDIGHMIDIPGLTDSIIQDIHKLNRFIIRVGSIHIGHKELSATSSMEYRKAALALIEQGISDTLCSLDQDLIPWEILDQVEVFFQYLDQHVIDDICYIPKCFESNPAIFFTLN